MSSTTLFKLFSKLKFEVICYYIGLTKWALSFFFPFFLYHFLLSCDVTYLLGYFFCSFPLLSLPSLISSPLSILTVLCCSGAKLGFRIKEAKLFRSWVIRTTCRGCRGWSALLAVREWNAQPKNILYFYFVTYI